MREEQITVQAPTPDGATTEINIKVTLKDGKLRIRLVDDSEDALMPLFEAELGCRSRRSRGNQV